ncbi:hypothetical protein BT96DRAFT_166320 [Gymnopus androsaceus JB14]|uniref:Serpentine receptor class gamma n=1 Tax=Gymnopus androsaceus JB14 TaxID=1447944 RepID=A0A6A4HCV0_9AGAR|nr:hypothetical protein BT96DRAFT_166320 [Gymnopus androsaceus JB14]
MDSLEASLEASFNGMYYGFVVSTVLFGVTTVQAWIYVRINRDSWLLRLLVASLVSLDFATTFLNSQTVYDLLLANFGNLESLFITPIPFKAEILISFVVIFITNTFFAYRIYLLRQIHTSVAFIVASTGTVALVMGLVASIKLLRTADELIIFASVKKDMIISLSLSVVSDILSTVAISWSLHTSRTGFKR